MSDFYPKKFQEEILRNIKKFSGGSRRGLGGGFKKMFFGSFGVGALVFVGSLFFKSIYRGNT